MNKTEGKALITSGFPRLWGYHFIPYQADGQIDEGALRAHVDKLADIPLDGLSVSGIAAEIFSLRPEERVRVAQVAVEAIAGRCRTYFPCSVDGTESTLEMVKKAESIGVDLAFVWTPYEFAKTDDDVLRFYEYIDANTDIAICAYSTPHAGRLMSPELIARLGQLPGVCAIKHVTFDYDEFVRARELAGDDIAVCFPFEEDWLRSIPDGNHALMTSPVQLFTLDGFYPLTDYTRLAFDGKLEEAKVIRDALEPVRTLWKEGFAVLAEGRHPMAFGKYWAHVLGLIDNPEVRAPEPQVPPEVAAKLKEVPALLEAVRDQLADA